MPKGFPNPKPQYDAEDVGVEIYPAATVAAIEANKPRMTPMRLKNNYRPYGEFEIVGHWQKAIRVKRADGKEIELQPEEFIKGDPAPAPQPGIGTSGKLWNGTIARFTSEEAKHLRKNGLADIEMEDDL